MFDMPDLQYLLPFAPFEELQQLIECSVPRGTRTHLPNAGYLWIPSPRWSDRVPGPTHYLRQAAESTALPDGFAPESG